MPVFTGVWYDHFSSKLVLTTDATSGGFLTAAVVIWVNLVATMTWPIFRYVLYTMSMKQRANLDVFYHQRQTTLRNSRSPTSTAAQLARLAWRWKSYRHRSILARSAPAALVCICISLAWVLCGLYAPYIYTKTGSDVLLTASDHCGLVGAGQGFEQNSAQVNNLLTAGQMAAVKAAETYAEQCYQTDGNTSLSSCGTYPQKQLNFTTGTAVCPFGDGSPCQTTNSTVVTFDTGLLDSSNDFGVNAPRYESIQYRRLTTCATVHTAGYVTVFNASNGPDASKYPPGSVFLRYDYGPLGGSNWTWEYSELWDSVPYPYYLTAIDYSPGVPPLDQSYFPNATLFDRTDADLLLVLFQGNAVYYTEPVYDPIFAAGLFAPDVRTITVANVSETYYTPSYPINVLGCIEQHQICTSPSGDHCTPLVAEPSIINATLKLREDGVLNDYQEATMLRMAGAVTLSSIWRPANFLGSSGLLASRTLENLAQEANLPINQWILEAKNWFTISLALLQSSMLSYAQGPTNPALNPYVVSPSDKYELKGCQTQRVPNVGGHINFDFPALLGLFIGGLVLIVFGQGFDRLVRFLGRFRRSWSEAHQAFLHDGLYQVQRLALSARGVLDWRDVDDEVPTSAGTVRGSSEVNIGSTQVLLSGKNQL